MPAILSSASEKAAPDDAAACPDGTGPKYTDVFCVPQEILNSLGASLAAAGANSPPALAPLTARTTAWLSARHACVRSGAADHGG